MRVGILGGAFDPPHNGHVALVRRAIEHFGLDPLLVRVVAEPGHRTVVAAPEARLVLAQLAFMEMESAEVELDSFARTVDSLEALALEDPIFLVGADELARFASWKNPERVLELAHLGVASRPGVAPGRLDALIACLPRADRVEVFELEPLPISSSEIRARVRRGESIAELVPRAVAAEIDRLGLYRGSARLD